MKPHFSLILTREDRCQFARDTVSEGSLVELEDLLQGLLKVLLITIPDRHAEWAYYKVST